VTERGLPLADGAPACPFVAFEDDRDERSSVPDHRHRCYAESRPAPRALAHQEAYCLSSAFPVCPTFQDWARREAARSRGGSISAQTASAPNASAAMHKAASQQALETAAAEAAAVAGSAAGSAAWGGAASDALGNDRFEPAAGDAASVDVDAPPDARPDDVVRRNPPRDWAAPPPWLASNEDRRRSNAEPPPFLGRRSTDPGQGLVGSPADRMAGGDPAPAGPEDEDDASWSSGSRSAAALGAGLSGAAVTGPGTIGGSAETTAAIVAPRRVSSGPPRREVVDDDSEDYGAHDDEPRRPGRRPRAYDQHLGGPDGPDWERPRRFEAYPTIRSRVGLPAVPRIAAMAGGIAILAIALFFLPTLLNFGGGPTAPAASGSLAPAAGSSASVAPTVPPAATPIVYTIKKNDTLSKVAAAHGITVEELLAANPTITNANRISEGQQITIPAPSGAPPDEVGASAAP
jgi:hypothetical protein